MRQIDHFIVGKMPQAARFGDVLDPNNGGVQARVGLGDAAVLAQAVSAAQAERAAEARSRAAAAERKRIVMMSVS